MISKTIEEIHAMIGGTLSLGRVNTHDVVCGVAIDSRKIASGNIFFASKGERTDSHLYLDEVYSKGARLAIIDNEENISSTIATILVDNSIEALQKLARVYRSELDVHIIAITGSNGKTSTKDLLASALSAKFNVCKTEGNQNNEIGVPLTLLRMGKETQFGIVEMGVEKFGDLHFLNDIAQPNTGILTSIGYAHTVNLKSLENVAKAKLELLDGISENGDFIVFGDDDIIQSELMKKKSLVPVHTFGNNDTNEIYINTFHQETNRIRFSSNLSPFEFTIPTLGRHQALNALSVLLCAYRFGLSNEQIQEGWNQFENTGKRNDCFHIKNMIVLDDSYKSNPQSAIVALDTFSTIHSPYKILLLGDMLDLGDNEIELHRDLAKTIIKYPFDELIGYGDLSKHIVDATRELVGDKKYTLFSDHKQVNEYLQSYINEDCALLVKGSRGMQLDVVVDFLKHTS